MLDSAHSGSHCFLIHKKYSVQKSNGTAEFYYLNYVQHTKCYVGGIGYSHLQKAHN